MNVRGRTITVVDTPGQDISMHPTMNPKEIVRAIPVCADGYNACIIVMRYPIRYTLEDAKVFRELQLVFGEEMGAYSLLAITGGDVYRNEMRGKYGRKRICFKNVVDSLRSESHFREVLEFCRGGWILIDNFECDATKMDQQMNELIELVDDISHSNAKKYDQSTFLASTKLPKELKPFTAFTENSFVSVNTSWNWSDEEKKTLSEMSGLCVIFLGEKEAGKSSLVNTILQGKSYTTHKDDRTVVADISHWIPTGKPRTVFTIVDLGGHNSYRVTGHFFLKNAKNNVAVLCHDISVDDHSQSFVWVQSVLTSSPKCNILVILSKSDQVASEQEMEKKKADFVTSFDQFIENEVKKLQIFIKSGRHINPAKMQQFTTLKDKYTWLSDNIKHILIVTSCNPGHMESVHKFTKVLEDLAENSDNKVKLPEHMQLLYMHVGKKGAQLTEVTNYQTSQKHGYQQTWKKSEGFLSRLGNMLSRLFSTEAASDIKTSSSVIRGINTNQPNVENTNIHSSVSAVPYLYFKDVIPTYVDILKRLRITADSTEEHLKYTLTCLHYHGLLMYYLGGQHIEEVIFHDINAVLKILKSIFHHKMPDYLHMKTTDVHKYNLLLAEHYNMNELEFLEDSKHAKHGLLSESLIVYLLAVNECSIKVEVVLQLLEHLEAGYSFKPEELSKRFLFIPYFVSNKEIDPETEQQVRGIQQCQKDALSLHCRLKGNLPVTFWNYLVVRLLNQLQLKLQARQVWSGGFWATVGKKKAKVLLLYNGPEEIGLYVKGDITDIAGHNLIWRYVRLINDETDRLCTHWWPGLITGKSLVCTHCRIRHWKRVTLRDESEATNRIETNISNGNEACIGDANEASSPPSELDLDYLLSLEPGNTETLCCDGSSEIHAGLVMPLATENSEDLKSFSLLREARDYINQSITPSSNVFDKIAWRNKMETENELRKQTMSVGYGLTSDHKLKEEDTTYIWKGLAPSVCRVKVPGCVGTGFVVGSVNDETTGLPHRFLLTCHHLKIQDSIRNQQPCSVQFGFHEVAQPPAVEVNVFPHIFAENAQLDYVLLCLEHSPLLESYLAMRVKLADLIHPEKPSIKDPLVIIGHSEGKELKLDPSVYCDARPVLPQGIVDYDCCVFYQCCSYHGASGSPCFSAQKRLIYAMHSGGDIKGPGIHVGASSNVEYGVLLWDVINDIKFKVMSRYFQTNVTGPQLKIEGLYELFPQLK